MMDVVDDDARGERPSSTSRPEPHCGGDPDHTPIGAYSTPRTSTSKTSVEPGGMSGGAPASPYAIDGGNTSFRRPPTFMPLTPSSHPVITCPAPSVKAKGSPRSRLLSNF